MYVKIIKNKIDECNVKIDSENLKTFKLIIIKIKISKFIKINFEKNILIKDVLQKYTRIRNIDKK